MITICVFRYREPFVYYADNAWEKGYTSSENFTRWENTPREDWDIRGRREAIDHPEDGFLPGGEEPW
jgi:hypothetical protein